MRNVRPSPKRNEDGAIKSFVVSPVGTASPKRSGTARLRVENPMQYVQAFLSVHGARCYAKHLKIIEYVGFDTGKTCLCRRKIVRFNGKGDVLMLYKPVVPFGKLRFSAYRNTQCG